MSDSSSPLLPARPFPGSLGRALLVIFGAFALFLLGRRIPLPGLDVEAVTGLTGRRLLGPKVFSVFALGVTPLFTALTFFEVAKLLAPALARYEVSEPRNRARLRLYLRGLALVLAAFQAWWVAKGFEAIPGLVPTPGGPSRRSSWRRSSLRQPSSSGSSKRQRRAACLRSFGSCSSRRAWGGRRSSSPPSSIYGDRVAERFLPLPSLWFCWRSRRSPSTRRGGKGSAPASGRTTHALPATISLWSGRRCSRANLPCSRQSCGSREDSASIICWDAPLKAAISAMQASAFLSNSA